MNHSDYKSNNLKALSFLVLPSMLVLLSVVLFSTQNLIFYGLGTLSLSLFFTQTFFLLHECGHLNFFITKTSNKIFGNIFGFLNVIPFFTWQHMHNLHHKWTGWRDLDPTTEETVKPSTNKLMQLFVNICWLLFIPVFYLAYMLSNYWNIFKIKRFVSIGVFKISVLNIFIYLILYLLLFYFFSSFILHYILPAFLISSIWKELVIMTQHSHIEIPISEGMEVRPVPYTEQVKYTRSFYTHPFISKYFLLNFNLHEVHHVYPGLPAYWLDQINLEVPKTPNYSEWFKQAKSMKGVDYIFKTTKQTGKKF